MKILIISLLLALASCGYIERESEYDRMPDTSFKPVYMSLDELRSSVKIMEARPLKNPGKIYMKGTYLFVSERFEGVHVIDDSDPKSPKPIAFISMPGNVDISAKGDMLYADNVVDLVVIDISALPSISVASRVENVFPHHPTPPDGLYFEYDASKGIVAKWIK